ncbi:hydantoinase/oxoprolinase family protein [Aestuariivirga sp. YIM B02566]|uniref:Hydantoinase/oxoprolinase family protein n=1 Tax=Taklimakanibacter albus TaxID=2800327 RepID=A0ACC5R482_9HYPH|nr:hydantoinase/oxoprolinase family protein [Aestuariivirga sp. YIM B02566]MBK1867427.1 hydantoinase/oxoprolinase family protein [Aestuariivirga sp. YIM B02566]
MQFAIDTGGTFTDLVVKDASGFCRMFKSSTTPADPISGVLNVLEVAAAEYGMTRAAFLSEGRLLVHGTTHALNAIVTGRTAKTAFIATKGHGDMLVLREGGRTDPFNFDHPNPEPYIPRALTFEVTERTLPDGSVMLPLDEEEIASIAVTLKRQRVEAVAVCLLWSIVNPYHEQRIGTLLGTHLPGIPVTLSHELNPIIREFRRASSAAIDASLKPMMGIYMSNLEARLREAGFPGRVLVITSQGGVIDAKDAATAPIHIVNSGPSMAPMAGRHFAAIDEGSTTAIVADTGGTTYDVSLVRKGHVPIIRETWIGAPHRGTMIGFPWVDVKSVGAGGGSIAWVDSGGLLHVGPQSAGSVPGPVAYGKGGVEPTVTDASLVLGHLDGDSFLGGAMKLDRKLAEAAIRKRVAEPLGISVEAAADAILAVVTENMVQAINTITVNQGIDPKDAILIGGGGGAGLNSVRIAKRLGCRTLLIPAVGAALSAAGAMMSGLKAHYQAAAFAATDRFDFDRISDVLSGLAERCQAFAAASGAGAESVEISYTADARYSTQVWEIEVPLRSGKILTPTDLGAFIDDFHKTHQELFNFSDPSSPIEIVGWRAQVHCRFKDTGGIDLARTDEEEVGSSTRRSFFAQKGWCDVPVHNFEALAVNEFVTGPLIVESPFTTVVVEPGVAAARRPSGSLSINMGATQ